MAIFSVILSIIILVSLVVYTQIQKLTARDSYNAKSQKLDRDIEKAVALGDVTEEQGQLRKKEILEQHTPPLMELPSIANKAIVGFCGLLIFLGSFNSIMFYAEPSYNYHVRTIVGTESAVMGETGWHTYWFGRVEPWKRNMTVQASKTSKGNDQDNEEVSTDEDDAHGISANLGSIKLIFLDQVDAKGYATTRFRLPADEQMFLTLAHDYRTPGNLLRTSLIPSFKETLSATSALMSAESYFSGSKTEFNVEFENQMENGIYIVKRIEKRVDDGTLKQLTSANASRAAKGEVDDTVQETSKVVFVVEKQFEADGITLRRKSQKFTDYGIRVVEARITDMIPNLEFENRMKQKQQASADRAIAREKRIQEEEQKLFAIAKGEREVAEKQAAAKVVQIEKTTDAETSKQLAITLAEQQLEKARIEKATAQQALERDRIKAQGIKVLADANAYDKRVMLEADGALKLKLDATVQMNKDMADAIAKKPVPQTVIYGGVEGKGGLGSNDEVSNILDTQLIKNVQALNLDKSVK